MMRCGYCGRYVREHLTRYKESLKEWRFDRHTEAPFSNVWCAGSGKTLQETQVKSQPEPPVAGAKP